MEDTQIETLSDADLEHVAGGHGGVSLSISGEGISLEGPLGAVHVPNPLTIAGKLVGGTLEAAGAVLEGAGHAIGSIGRHL
jgi:hypothetical protein